MWETICGTETFKALSSRGPASARSLNRSANYHLRVLALLRRLGKPPHPATHTACAFRTWGEWRACWRVCRPHVRVCLHYGCSWAMHVHQYVCTCLWMIPCESSRCWGLVKHFWRQLRYSSCLGGFPPWFLWNETIWETSRHLIWRLIRLFGGRARACIALMV